MWNPFRTPESFAERNAHLRRETGSPVTSWRLPMPASRRERKQMDQQAPLYDQTVTDTGEMTAVPGGSLSPAEDGYAPGAEDLTELSAADTLVTSIRAAEDHREVCPQCRGTGRLPTVNDLLRDIWALAEGAEDEVVRLFYVLLLERAPSLAPLFPADLLQREAPEGGREQRDRLVNALRALCMLYDPADRKAMDRLNHALVGFGERHAAFNFPDGTMRAGATQDEYGAVKAALVDTLHEVTGDKWLPEYDGALSEAYDHAWAKMSSTQRDVVNPFGRFPRPSR
jgi:hemoglobin-like flavoprotein